MILVYLRPPKTVKQDASKHREIQIEFSDKLYQQNWFNESLNNREDFA